MYIVVGLGNAGEEYSKTRHNAGQMAGVIVEEEDVDGVKVVRLDTYMNKSGPALAKVVKSKKSAQKLIVIYDDLDLPLGTLKISYDRGSGGHRGVESIIKALGTREFIRIRIGITPTTPSGKLKKQKEVEKFILGEFKKPEVEILKKVFKKVVEAVETIVEHGYTRAMTEFNK
ncbi:MAG: aminoacyl-tRNA hydrolase [Parcubacteria group bacterium]